MKEITFIWIADPSHSFLAVPMELIEFLDIKNCISRYSYYNPENQIVFLEEDCDAGIFLMEMSIKGFGFTTETHSRGPSFVRHFQVYPFTDQKKFEMKMDQVAEYYSRMYQQNKAREEDHGHL